MNQKEGLEFLENREERNNPQIFGNTFQVPWSIMDEDLTIWEKVLLSMVVSFAINGSEFYMSNAYLADKFQLCTKTISNSVKNLSEKGFIKAYHKHSRFSIKTVGRTLEPTGKYYIEVRREANFVYKEYIFTN